MSLDQDLQALIDAEYAKARAVVLIQPDYLDVDGHAAWKAQSRIYLSGFNY